MTITIVVSIQFSNEALELKGKLEALGHTVFIPYSTEQIASGKLALIEYIKEKEANGDRRFREKGRDLIKDHYHKILKSDAILVANYTKKGIKNYIGGNALMELGFAHVHDKKIFLLNSIPEMSYTDEIQAVHPVILNGHLDAINI